MQNDHVERALLAQKHTDAHLPMLVTSSATGNVTAHAARNGEMSLLVPWSRFYHSDSKLST